MESRKMVRRIPSICHKFEQFLAEEDGLSTVDWVLLCCGATGAAMVFLDLTQGALDDHSAGIRSELQSPYFQTAWAEALEIPPREVWDTGGGAGTGGGTTDPTSGGGTGTGNGNGNGNGNNGHGNDADGCDSSNPGNNPNCAGDTTDDDGTPGNSAGNGGGTTGGNTGGGTTGGGNTGGGNTGGGTTTPPPAPTGPQVVTGVIAGCPSPAYIAEPVEIEGDEIEGELIRFNNLPAGGAAAATSCAGLPGGGYFHANPAFTFSIEGFDDDWSNLRIRTNNACEARLLVRDAAGNWYGGRTNNTDNRVRVPTTEANLNGLISVWIGLDDPGSCSGVQLRIDIEG
jgi:hypothetical protein